jgi:hypothetical protein
MDNLVVLHTGHALDLLRVLLRLLRDQLLQMLDGVLQLGGLSLTHLELLVSLVQLDLEVMDVALNSNHLILGVLQPSAGVVEEVRLHVATAVGPHAHFQAVVLLKKLNVTLLDVLDEAVLSRHLVVILLQA